MRKDLPIPTSSKRSDAFIPATLKDTPKEAEFELRIPTPSERDVLTSTLFELGLTNVSEETLRAHMVNELFNIDWIDSDLSRDDTKIIVTPGMTEAGLGFLKSFKKGADPVDLVQGIFTSMLDAREAKLFENAQFAEEKAAFLDGYWIRNEADERAMNLWMEQEGQRLLDEGEGVKKDPNPMPARSVPIREHSQVRILLDSIQERSIKIRKMISRRMDYGARNALLMVRLHVLRMTPADKEAWPQDLVLERDETGMLSVPFTDRLREHIGPVAWAELVNRADSHYSLSEIERKNSGSPQGKPSDQTGSPAPSGDLESNGGGATESSTGPAPDGESETTTAKS